jgi:hypothetical protein
MAHSGMDRIHHFFSLSPVINRGGATLAFVLSKQDLCRDGSFENYGFARQGWLKSPLIGHFSEVSRHSCPESVAKHDPCIPMVRSDEDWAN